MVATANMVEVAAFVGDMARAAKLAALIGNEGEGYAVGRLPWFDPGHGNGCSRRYHAVGSSDLKSRKSTLCRNSN